MATINSAELHRIGDGPVATVYSGHRGGVPVALKVFPKRLDKRTLAAFNKEQAKLSAMRNVTSILPVDGIDELDTGEPAVRMELCGQSLAALVDRAGSLPPADVVVLGRSVAEALAAAHGSGVVHGGMSPHNILFRANGEPALADFGVTLRHAFARDPLYAIEFLPPETLRTGVLNESTDLYGLGAVLHYALSGRSPHPGRLGEQPGERVLRILGEPVPAINAPNVPLGLSTLVARLLATDPTRRPNDSKAVAEQLNAMLPNAPRHPAAEDFDDFGGPQPVLPPPPPRQPPAYPAHQTVSDDFRGSRPVLSPPPPPRQPPPAHPGPPPQTFTDDFDDFAVPAYGGPPPPPAPSHLAAPPPVTQTPPPARQVPFVRAPMTPPVAQPPFARAPAAQPRIGQPPAAEVSVEPPVTPSPATRPPVAEVPVAEVSVEPLVARSPATRPSVAQVPVAEVPVGEPSVTPPPAGQPPVAEPPASQASVISPSTSSAPIAEPSTPAPGGESDAGESPDSTPAPPGQLRVLQSERDQTGISEQPPPAPTQTGPPFAIPDPDWSDFTPSTPPTFTPPTEPERRKPRYDLLAGAGVLLAVVALVLLLVLRDEPEELTTTARVPDAAPPEPEVEVELSRPTDLIDRVELNWRSTESELDFAVVVAVEGEKEPKTLLAKRKQSMTVPVQPGRKYCFQVQATNGVDVYESDPQPLRGATCRE